MDVICAIQKQKKNCLQQQLGFELDEMGYHGRFTNANLDENNKCPKLLSNLPLY